MNIKSIIIAAVALTLGLSACNKEEDLTQQDGIPVNAVRITATVGNPFATTRSNPVGTVEEQAKFNSGDRVLVRIPFSTKKVIYQFDGTNWTAENDKYLLWDNNEEDFIAEYPLNEEGKYIDLVEKNQSILEKLVMSDLMRYTIENAQKGEILNFEMERKTKRIIVKIAGFNPEFSPDSKVTDVKIMIGNPYTNPTEYVDHIPYTQGEEGSIGKVGTTYTLLAGGEGDDQSKYITLKVGDKEMRTANLPYSMYSGKSYTYNLVVGKEKLEIESVTVEDWTTKDVVIPGGQAEEDLGS